MGAGPGLPLQTLKALPVHTVLQPPRPLGLHAHTLFSRPLQSQFLLPEAQSPQIALTEGCSLDQRSNTPHGRRHSHRHSITFPCFIILPKTCRYLTHLSALCFPCPHAMRRWPLLQHCIPVPRTLSTGEQVINVYCLSG